MTIGCNIRMICLILIWFFYGLSRMFQLPQFVWALRCSVWDVFINFLLIDATDRSKISSNQKRFFIALSLYTLSFFTNTPFKKSRSFPTYTYIYIHIHIYIHTYIHTYAFIIFYYFYRVTISEREFTEHFNIHFNINNSKYFLCPEPFILVWRGVIFITYVYTSFKLQTQEKYLIFSWDKQNL